MDPRPKSFPRKRVRPTSAPYLSPQFSHRLMGAIAVWHDIHSNLLRVPVDDMALHGHDRQVSLLDMLESDWSSSLSDDEEEEAVPSASLAKEEEDEEEDENEEPGPLRAPRSNLATMSKLSISNPELASCAISEYYPSLSEHWRSIMTTRLRKLSEGMPRLNPFKTPVKQVVERDKRPLWSTLSWDAERRSRSPSTASRPRLHSDGDGDNEAEPAKRKESGNKKERDRSRHREREEEREAAEKEEEREMEQYCTHCALLAEHRRRVLKVEIESAVTRLARRLGASGRTNNKKDSVTSNASSCYSECAAFKCGSPVDHKAPDIVVSSISSDEEMGPTRHNSSSERASLQTSDSSCSSTVPSPGPCLPDEEPSSDYSSAECSFASCAPLPPSPLAPSPLVSRPLNLLSVTPDPNPPRSNSVDLSTLQRDLELYSISSADSSPPTPTESIRTVRSRSHDPAGCAQLRRPSKIEHLTDLFRHERMAGRALAKSPARKNTVSCEHIPPDKHRTARFWTDDKVEPIEHLWLPCSSSSDETECYLGDRGKCERSGDKLRCTACHVVAHNVCIIHLTAASVACKTTFREPQRKGREAIDAMGGHHWVHRWKYEGRCSACGKAFHQKIFFKGNEKREPVAVTCSWCKDSFHVKNCFDDRKLSEKCDRGTLRDLIVPPPWIVRATKKRKASSQNQQKTKAFIVRRAESWLGCPTQPLLVFVNPKSGGNKGAKALQTFCWLLNPRQVFDITALKGPKFGLELYRKVLTQLRILVCGGDGTVGWVLATLDKLNWPAYPPIAIMPFGTGNDLSRCLGWGGAFSDEPLSQLLNSIVHETSVTQLDRWRLQVSPNVDSPIENEEDEEVHSALPLTVMNNYFSIGADAHVALQFHHSRSANPQMLNSRLKNRIAYGGLGTIDLFRRSWKDLAEYVHIECDGVDITPKIKELKLHCILFHNITYYAGGTVPWGTDSDDGFSKASVCDGKIEVLGFTTATLAALQMGGRGERLAQCTRATMRTSKAIPMQVDGEPCLLAPSNITLTFHSKVPMMRREKKAVCAPSLTRKGKRKKGETPAPQTSVIVHLPVLVVGRHDYDTYKDSLERLKDTAFEIGTIKTETEMELSRARQMVQKLLVDHPCLPYEYSTDWRFLDYVSNADEGTFRLSRQQESLMALSDASNTDDCLLILDDAFPSMTSRSREIGTSNIIFMPSSDASWNNAPSSSSSSNSHSSINRRISETLRIVLSSDAQETHL